MSGTRWGLASAGHAESVYTTLVRPRLSVFVRCLLYAIAISALMHACTGLLTSRDYGDPTGSAVLIMTLVAGAGTVGTVLFGTHLDLLEFPYQRVPGRYFVDLPYLKAALLSALGSLPPLYAVVQYTFLRYSLPSHSLEERSQWSIVLAVAASLALMMHRRYGVLLVFPVFAANAWFLHPLLWDS